MLPNKTIKRSRTDFGQSAGALPLALTVATILLLLMRFGLFIVSQSGGKAKPNAQIAWQSVDLNKQVSSKNRELTLYYFHADDSIACLAMDNATLMNKDVIKEIVDNFQPVKINYETGADGKYSTKQMKLRSLYAINGVPTLVVALPDGTFVQQQWGYFNSLGTLAFLTQARQAAIYKLGAYYFNHLQFKQSADAYKQWLEQTKYRHYDNVWAVAYAYAAYRLSGQDIQASTLLNESKLKITDSLWPVPILKYLRGELKAEELIAFCHQDVDRLTKARYFIGLKLYLDHNLPAAKAEFEWVSKNGNPNFFEYMASNWMLRKMSNL